MDKKHMMPSSPTKGDWGSLYSLPVGDFVLKGEIPFHRGFLA